VQHVVPNVRLFYFRDPSGISNFGDELNLHLWPRLLPGALDDDDGTQFVGIGTLLNDHLPAAARTVVFGAGVGYYGPPRRSDTWCIYCVRGPLSARALGLDADVAVTDPAALVARLEPTTTTTDRWRYAFMPHWQTEPDVWRALCANIGCGFIDPRGEPETVIAALGRTDVLITEAMHGAIVADALRVPWIPVRTRETINSFKWEDWCQSMALDYAPHVLPSIWPAVSRLGVVASTRRRAKLAVAARALARLSKRATPVLSRAEVLRDRLDQLEERLHRLRTSEPACQLRPFASSETSIPVSR
jgi:succinoglycan biosynthesis protein ExoV